MKWMVGGAGWPVNGGAWLIPAGTMLEGVARDGELVEAPKWNEAPLPMPMPLDVVALDEDAALMMLKWYGPEHWHRIIFGPNIDRELIKGRKAALDHEEQRRRTERATRRG
jgi:hypothetical protein